MNLRSLISRTSSCNQQPGADQIKTPYFLRGTIPAGTNLPLLSRPSWAVSGLNFGYKTMVTHRHTHKKNPTIFDSMVTIFFRLQRKLEEKNYLFEDSCPEETTLLYLWTRALWITYLLLLLLSRFSRVWLCATPETAAHQAPPSLGFSRQEHWSGLPFSSPMHESEKWKWSHSVVSDSLWPMDCSLPGSSIHGIFQARVLEWVAIAFSGITYLDHI